MLAGAAGSQTTFAQTPRPLIVDASAEIGSTTYRRIQAALRAAGPGDTIVVRPGRYAERLRSVRAGRPDQAITVRAETGAGSVVVTDRATVLRVDHPHHVFEGLVFDGQYGPRRTVDVRVGADHTVLRDVEVRHAARDCVRVRAVSDVRILSSRIHHCLNATGGRRDAHGLVVGAARRLTVRDTDIHSFSGDAIQVDPGRAPAGWTDVVLDGCRLWLEPLAEGPHGFPAGTIPGENAVDTKTWPEAERARLVVRDTVAWGFRDGPITNMAAFNLKEHVRAELDGVTVFDSEIAFRVRGDTRQGPGAEVVITNAVVHDVEIGVRYENDIEHLAVWNSTVGLGVPRPFVAARAPRSRPDVRNTLFLGRELPAVASPESNRAVAAEAFVAAAEGDYRLRPGSVAVDAGLPLESVTHDRDGRARPAGPAHDLGAFETGERR